MVVHDPAGGGAAKAGGETSSTVSGFDLDAEGAEHIDTPGGTRVLVLFEAGHWVCDGGVDEPEDIIVLEWRYLWVPIREENIPMTAGDIVVVTAGPHALGDVGPDGFDSGKSLESRHDGQNKLWETEE